MLVSAQDECPASQDQLFLHGNEVRAAILNNGGLFTQEFGVDGGFQVPYSGAQSPNTLFTSGLWMAGIDPGGNLKLTANSYAANGEGLAAGPYDPSNGPDETACANWDKIFTVYNYEIIAHIDDFNDNGTIENPLENIYGWPGLGNPHFEGLYGFELPALAYGLAPFFDQDGDGTYDPDQGDYPMIPQSDAIPAQMTFSIFNDASKLPSVNGNPLEVEVHLTTWSFYCEEEDPLNQTVFTSHKLISKSTESLDSTVVSIFIDADLGCFTDDYIGTASDLNTAYAYNADPIDGDPGNACFTGIIGYAENPPVQAFTVLNQPLFKSIYYNNAGVNNPSPGTTDPSTAVEYYRYLNGEWKDGTPLTAGGNGYNPGGGTPTDFVFTGDPNVSGEWSMFDQQTPVGDVRQLLSVAIGDWQPGQVFTLDMAWSFHQTADLNHVETVSYMRDRVEEIQQDYDSQFAGSCTFGPNCLADCIWPGDTNADGIANHEDLLNIGTLNQSIGNVRNGLLYWAPWTGQDWMQNLPDGPNAKHVDTNADGQVSQADIDQIETHYDFITPWYEMPSPVYPQGPELYWEPILNTESFDELEAGQNVSTRLRANPTPGLYGLSFTVELDAAYFDEMQLLFVDDCGGNCWVIEKNKLSPAIDGTIEYDIAITQTEGLGDLSDYLQVWISALLKDEFNEPMPSNTTSIRLRNLRGVDAAGNDLSIGVTDPILTIPEITVSDTEELPEEPIQVFPNPNKGFFEVRSPYQISSWTLYDMGGKPVETQESLTTKQFALQLSTIQSGIYFLALETTHGIYWQKIIIQ